MTLLTSGEYSVSYIQSFSNQNIGGLNLPIPIFNTSNFTKDLILVKCTNDNPTNLQTSVGTVVQMIALDNGELVSVDSHRIYLGTQFLELKAFSPYYLRVFPLSRLRQLTLSVREYNG